MIHIIEFKPNRTLYSQKLGGKIRLLDILQAVKDGEEILVRDWKNRDCTEYFLSRAFLKHVVLPIDVYRDLIKYYYERG